MQVQSLSGGLQKTCENICSWRDESILRKILAKNEYFLMYHILRLHDGHHTPETAVLERQF